MLKRGEWVNCGSEYHLFVLLLLFRGQLDPLSSKCGISSIAKIEISVLFYEHCYWAHVKGAYIEEYCKAAFGLDQQKRISLKRAQWMTAGCGGPADL